MALSAGARLGSYEILSPLGAGGMGEVYRARDTRLGREVAIKVLPAERLNDEHRRLRFVQEAQSASALNHPNIITIFEIESAGDVDFIVMEYVRGASLDTLIPRQGLRLNELLRTAIPVADALAAAHARGIIHRDLKPANVMVGSSDGVIKVLDFGLAKLVDDETAPEERTVTETRAAGLSVPGAIMGTAAYMAPEQATGGRVDARSDIFSFGAMLYEMATGTRAFSGSTMADTIAAVLRAQPTPPTHLVGSVPRDVERLILRCLRKEPERRYQSMLDVRNELREIKEESDSGTLGAPASTRRPRGRAVAAAAVAVAVVVIAVAWFLRPRAAADVPPMRVVPLTSLNGIELWPTLSPDGKAVAFSWDGEKNEGSKIGRDHLDIYLKQVGSSDLRRLTTDPGWNWSGGWSPDGTQIACLHEGPQGSTISLISPVSGARRKLIDFSVLGSPLLAWSPDGNWIVAAGDVKAPDGGGLYLIPVDGAAPRRLAQPKAPQVFTSPALAPDGRHLAYLACVDTSGGPSCDVEVMELDERWQPVSAPRRLTSPVNPGGGLVWSRDGASVIYSTEPLPETFYLWRAWVNGDRVPERLEVAGLGARMPAIASARNRLAFVRTLYSMGVSTLEPAPRPVLKSSFWDIQPQFSPDGGQLVFTSSRSGEELDIWLASADGSSPHQLTRGPGRKGSPAWSPDGHRIAFDSKGDDGRSTIWTIDADGGAPRQITKGPRDQNTPTWSRDGRWIYFLSTQGAVFDTWRVPATGGPLERVTRDGSTEFALESLDGRDLVYKRQYGDAPLLALPLAGGPARQLVPCVDGVNYAVGGVGIFYAACGPGPERSIHLLDKAGRDRIVGNIQDSRSFGLARLAVAPDDKTILIQQGSVSNDLMVIENFR